MTRPLPIQFFHTKRRHYTYLKWMRPLIQEMHDRGAEFWHPDLKQCPWQVNCRVNGHLFTMWPSSGKMAPDRERSVCGNEAVRRLFENAFDEASVEFNPIDDKDDFNG